MPKQISCVDTVIRSTRTLFIAQCIEKIDNPDIFVMHDRECRSTENYIRHYHMGAMWAYRLEQPIIRDGDIQSFDRVIVYTYSMTETQCLH